MVSHPCKGCTVSKLSFGVIFRYMPLPGRAFARPGLYLMADSVLGFSLSQSDQNTINLLSRADFIQEMSYCGTTSSIPNGEITSIIPNNTSWTECYVITHTFVGGMMGGLLFTGNGILRITPSSGQISIPCIAHSGNSIYSGGSLYTVYNVSSQKISFTGLNSISWSGIPYTQIHATFAFFL